MSEKREGDHRRLKLKGIPPSDLNMYHSTENAAKSWLHANRIDFREICPDKLFLLLLLSRNSLDWITTA